MWSLVEWTLAYVKFLYKDMIPVRQFADQRESSPVQTRYVPLTGDGPYDYDQSRAFWACDNSVVWVSRKHRIFMRRSDGLIYYVKWVQRL
jgi:hypothetical protein